MAIPINKHCEDCGILTWREELGVKDRFWDGGFVCHKHMVMRILESPGGHLVYLDAEKEARINNP